MHHSLSRVPVIVLWLFTVYLVFVWARRLDSDNPDDYEIFGPQQRRMQSNNPKRKVNNYNSGDNNGYVPVNKDRKPNVVLILTDDQDIELGSLNFMKNTLKFIRDEGAEFRHAYVTTPMCCPSRSSLLTGMYVHNHHVFTNNDNCSSTEWQTTHETRSFATYLSNAGYRTGYFGKYLNKYNGSYIPPGWREWGGLIMNSKYYNYSINMNGKKIKHGADYYKDYYPDLIANDSIAFLRQSKQNFARKPVMLTMSFPAPHGPEDSAPQFSDMFFNVTTHHTPSYDHAPNPDKQWILQVTQKMQPIHKKFTDLLMTKRLQTLQSVDDAVRRVYNELKILGELDNTYIIYTSDHGYHLGQFGLIKGKSFPFEFDVRVPFLIRGPGIEANTKIDDIILNIDLAPTFLDIAGVDTPSHMDGKSIMKLLDDPKDVPKHRRVRGKWPDTFLIESSGRRETPEQIAEAKLRARNRYSQLSNTNLTSTETTTAVSVTTEAINSTLATDLDSTESDIEDDDDEFGDDGEFLDQATDETEKPADDPDDDNDNISDIITRPELQLDNRVLPVVPPNPMQHTSKFQRIAMECQQPEMQAQCQPGQKWRCIQESDSGRWRKHKCKYQLPPKSHRQQAQSMKKCACFTPAGVVYTRLEEDGHSLNAELNRGSLPFDNWTQRNKRSFQHPLNETNPVESLLTRFPSVAYVTSKMNSYTLSRAKRESDKQMASIMQDLQHLYGMSASNLNVTFASDLNKPSLFTNTIPDAGINPSCMVLPNGNVNCSNIIYHDPKTWRRSRNSIDAQIHKLRMQLDDLKEIRRHLKEKRPVAEELIESTTLRVENVTQDHQHRHQHKVVSTTTTTSTTTPTTTTTEAASEKTTETERNRKLNGIRGPARIDVSVFGPAEVPNLHHRNSAGSNSDRRLPPLLISENEDQHTCYCEPNLQSKFDEKKATKEAKRKIKEERMRKKERKARRKQRMEKECLSERMNCFSHDKEHWKTAPLWTEGPFCFCMNANNNTYSCVRTINATHNFLYCEFVTGLATYYNLRLDPFQQYNRLETLSPTEKSFLHDQLETLKRCQGRQCIMGSPEVRNSVTTSTMALQQSLRNKNRRKFAQCHGGDASSCGDKNKVRQNVETRNYFDQRRRLRQQLINEQTERQTKLRQTINNISNQ